MDPENKAAKNKVTICAHEIKSIKEKEKKTFANMFEKVTIYSQYILMSYVVLPKLVPNFAVCSN